MIKDFLTYEERRLISRVLYGKAKRKLIYKDFIIDKSYIFIHIPKAAGKSVSLKVYGDDKPGHYSVKDYIFYDKKKFKNSFVFTFVREPIDRFMSAYNFLQQGGSCEGDYRFKVNVIDNYKNINDFIDKWVSKRNILKKEHFIPQSYFVLDDSGELAVDFVGKLENLSEDFQYVCDKCNLKGSVGHYNQSSKKQELELSQSSLKKLQELYQEDFERFGY